MCNSNYSFSKKITLDFPTNEKKKSIGTQCFCMSCFFNIAIFSNSFSDAKWIWISLESLMIELYLHMKIYLDYFPGMLKYAELGKSTRFTFWVPVPKAVEVIPWNLYTLILHKFTHLRLFQNMSLKNYADFYWSLGGNNFKIDCLKCKMRYGMCVHILLNNLESSP